MEKIASQEKMARAMRQIEIDLARESFFSFVQSAKHHYTFERFHKTIADKLQAVQEGRIKKLMIFTPPQHAKSELASRMFPAWVLGKAPGTKIIGASYSADLAQTFSREIQRTIDSRFYSSVFPDTYLARQHNREESGPGYIRTLDNFETVGKGGSYRAAGVTGSITGNPADIAIIDDPVKDAIEAYSQTYRDRVWDWYLNVLNTRLHNNSRVVLIMTRWHEDDLAGRILKDMAAGGEPWEILLLPALKEGPPTADDPRQEGEALWEKRHSAAKHLGIKRMSPSTFNSLYQQRPAPEEGNLFKKEWFMRWTWSGLQKLEDFNGEKAVWHFTADTAYTEKEKNDPSAFLAFSYFKNNLYIAEASRVYMEMPELIRYAKEFVKRNKYTDESTLKIEPKASGKSLVQLLKAETSLNVMEGVVPKTDKVIRARLCLPFCESRRVHVLEGAAWTDMFIAELCLFPNAATDDITDTLTMAIIDIKQYENETYLGFTSIG